jgi:hypothetical protein
MAPGHDDHCGAAIEPYLIADVSQAADDRHDARGSHPIRRHELLPVVDQQNLQSQHSADRGDALADMSRPENDKRPAMAYSLDYERAWDFAKRSLHDTYADFTV